MRPALVRGSKRHPPTQRGALLVSYGTTQLDSNNCAHKDLIIQNAKRIDELDLPSAVRFDLGLTNWLPWAAEYFQPPAHSLYVVAGPLSASEISKLRHRLKSRGELVPM